MRAQAAIDTDANFDGLSVGQASQDAVAGLRTLSAVPPGNEPPFAVGEVITRGSNRVKLLKRWLGPRLSPSEQARAHATLHLNVY